MEFSLGGLTPIVVWEFEFGVLTARSLYSHWNIIDLSNYLLERAIIVIFQGE